MKLSMKQESRDFIRSFTTQLDQLLLRLTQEERHDVLDALAGEVEERLDGLVEDLAA